MNNLISVIVPIYKTELYVERCVKSICNQSYSNLEIILVDDGSPDNAGDICDLLAEKDNRIKVIHKKNGGLSSARNAGLQVATGAYIGFVDSDDVIHKEMYQSLYTIINRESVSIAGVSILPIDEKEDIPSNTIIRDLSAKKIGNYEFICGLLNRTADCSVCSKLFEASLFQSHKFWEDRLNEDGLLLFNIFLDLQCQFAYTSEQLYFYVQRYGSICHQGFNHAISSMFDNYLFMENELSKTRAMYAKEANDAVIFACRTYAMTIPYQRFKMKEPKTMKVIFELRKRRKTIMQSNLTTRDKLIMILFSMLPILTEWLLMIVKLSKKSIVRMSI